MKKIIFFLLITVVFPIALFAQGCMEASSDEGVNVVGYLQAQYEYFLDGNDNQSSFTFNRARMGLVGNIPYDFSYYIMYEFSSFKPGAPYLLDGFITYSRFAPYLKLSVGQFKSPFSLELNTPCQGLHSIRRSVVVNELTNPQRDLGILFSGHYKELMKYAFSFTNASNFGERDNNNNKAFAGRLVISPLEYFSFGGSYKYGTVPPTEGTKEDERKRYALEFEGKYNDFLIQGEYIRAEDIGSYTTGGG